MRNFRPFHPCVIWQIPGNFLGGRTDRRTNGRTCRKTVTFARMDQQSHVHVERGYFRLRADGRTDGRTTRNIMPQPPKGGGIKIIALKVSDSCNKWDFYPVLYALWEMCSCLLHKLARGIDNHINSPGRRRQGPLLLIWIHFNRSMDR